jgi:hypothetical protein
VAIRKVVLGSDHVDVASSEAYLAEFMIACKRYDEAMTRAQHSLSILLKRDPDEDDVRAFTALGNA